jgi:serine/threonine-protein kinase ATR
MAVYKVSDMSTHKVNIKPWKGTVPLACFIPPVQAALSVSISSGGVGTYVESFPRQVPRMRSFYQEVGVMGSKARPKKLKVFVIAADTFRSSASLSSKSGRSSTDIGEIHFLVKQEAKGDLRKDARVQDFNNVVNRLMASSTFGKGASRYNRRLRLRTYTVTCLSEDTGILEWVPSTDSLRSLIAKSYNPQASPFSAKRRGSRVANFGDPMLRTNYEKKCQPMFFDNGNLRRAATMFDELCLKPYPPLLYWWFIQHFSDPHAWYEARTRFTVSAAIWSGVGHVIGLGDRHSENILVDTTSCDCVHVDFDWYVFLLFVIIC